MENINRVLQQITIEEDAKLQVAKESAHRVRVSMRFLFLEASSSAHKGVFYLPDYTWTEDKTAIYLQPKPGTCSLELKLFFEKAETVERFMLALQAIVPLRDEFFEENMPIAIEDSEKIGSQNIRISDLNWLQWVGKGKKEMKLHIGSTAKVLLPKLGKHIKMMVAGRGDQKPQRIEMPNFESLCRWYLVLALAIQADIQKIDRRLPPLVSKPSPARAPAPTQPPSAPVGSASKSQAASKPQPQKPQAASKPSQTASKPSTATSKPSQTASKPSQTAPKQSQTASKPSPAAPKPSQSSPKQSQSSPKQSETASKESETEAASNKSETGSPQPHAPRKVRPVSQLLFSMPPAGKPRKPQPSLAEYKSDLEAEKDESNQEPEPEHEEPRNEHKPEPEIVREEPKPEPEPEADLDQIDFGEIEIETVETTEEGDVIPVTPEVKPAAEDIAPTQAPAVDSPMPTQKFAVDTKKLEEVKEAVRQMENELKMQLDAYEPAIVAPPDLPEPELKFPESTHLLSGNQEYHENTAPKSEPMSLEILEKMVKVRIDDSKKVNYSRYNEKFVMPLISGSELGYDPLCPDSLRMVYKRATPEEAFILIAAVVANGSLPSVSMSPLFDAPRQASKQGDIITIVETLGTSVFSKILEFDASAENYYMPSAIVGDRRLIEVLARIPKEVIKPEEMPAVLPFQFPMNPLKCIEKWLCDTLYEMKVNKLDVKKSVFRLGRSLGEFFSSYLRPGKTLPEFVRELGETGLTSGAWSGFRQNQRNDFEAKWVFFWAFSFKDDKLSANFCEILKRGQLIDKYYTSCAPIRDTQTLRCVVEWLVFFESLDLASQLDLRNYEDKSFARLLARTAAWVESIGF